MDQLISTIDLDDDDSVPEIVMQSEPQAPPIKTEKHVNPADGDSQCSAISDENTSLDKMKYGQEDVFSFITEYRNNYRKNIGERSARHFEEDYNTFVKLVTPQFERCMKSLPLRSRRLAMLLNETLMLYHTYHLDNREALDQEIYYSKIIVLLGMYVNMEVRASTTGREKDNFILGRILTTLYTFLDHSHNHVVEVLLHLHLTYCLSKDKYDLMNPLFSTILQQEQKFKLNETLFVMYILAFRMWKKCQPNIEEKKKISTICAKILHPPERFKSMILADIVSTTGLVALKNKKYCVQLLIMQKMQKEDYLSMQKKFLQYLKEHRETGHSLEPNESLLFGATISSGIATARILDDDFSNTLAPTSTNSEAIFTSSISELINQLILEIPANESARTKATTSTNITSLKLDERTKQSKKKIRQKGFTENEIIDLTDDVDLTKDNLKPLIERLTELADKAALAVSISGDKNEDDMDDANISSSDIMSDSVGTNMLNCNVVPNETVHENMADDNNVCLNVDFNQSSTVNNVTSVTLQSEIDECASELDDVQIQEQPRSNKSGSSDSGIDNDILIARKLACNWNAVEKTSLAKVQPMPLHIHNEGDNVADFVGSVVDTGQANSVPNVNDISRSKSKERDRDRLELLDDTHLEINGLDLELMENMQSDFNNDHVEPLSDEEMEEDTEIIQKSVDDLPVKITKETRVCNDTTKQICPNEPIKELLQRNLGTKELNVPDIILNTPIKTYKTPPRLPIKCIENARIITKSLDELAQHPECHIHILDPAGSSGADFCCGDSEIDPDGYDHVPKSSEYMTNPSSKYINSAKVISPTSKLKLISNSIDPNRYLFGKDQNFTSISKSVKVPDFRQTKQHISYLDENELTYEDGEPEVSSPQMEPLTMDDRMHFSNELERLTVKKSSDLFSIKSKTASIACVTETETLASNSTSFTKPLRSAMKVATSDTPTTKPKVATFPYEKRVEKRPMFPHQSNKSNILARVDYMPCTTRVMERIAPVSIVEKIPSLISSTPIASSPVRSVLPKSPDICMETSQAQAQQSTPATAVIKSGMNNTISNKSGHFVTLHVPSLENIFAENELDTDESRSIPKTNNTHDVISFPESSSTLSYTNPNPEQVCANISPENFELSNSPTYISPNTTMSNPVTVRSQYDLSPKNFNQFGCIQNPPHMMCEPPHCYTGPPTLTRQWFMRPRSAQSRSPPYLYNQSQTSPAANESENEDNKLDTDEVQTTLPFKKRRKLTLFNVSQDIKLEDSRLPDECLSYPATPMISIAELEALQNIHHLQQGTRRTFKTPAQLKDLPPLNLSTLNALQLSSFQYNNSMNMNHNQFNSMGINNPVNNVDTFQVNAQIPVNFSFSTNQNMNNFTFTPSQNINSYQCNTQINPFDINGHSMINLNNYQMNPQHLNNYLSNSINLPTKQIIIEKSQRKRKSHSNRPKKCSECRKTTCICMGVHEIINIGVKKPKKIGSNITDRITRSSNRTSSKNYKESDELKKRKKPKIK